MIILGQEGLVDNFANYEYEDRPNYDIEIGKKFNPDSLHNHPELGVLPFDKPYGKNVVEDLSKRTALKRYYVDLDNPNYFYIQKSSRPINYLEDDNWIALSPYLEKVNPNNYSAPNQPFPTFIDIEDKYTSIQIGSEKIKFNNYTITVELMDGTTANYDSDWTNIEIGNKATYIRDVFPDIDMRIIFKKGAIKTDFIFDNETAFKTITFIDNFDIPSNFAFVDTSLNGNSSFLYLMNSETEINYAKIGKVKSYDSSGADRGWRHNYHINGNDLSFKLDSSFLHNDTIVYPLVIDPLITAVGPIGSGANALGSTQAPGLCSDNISVVFPGGSTPWDVSVSWEIYTEQCLFDALLFGGFNPCFLSEAQVRLSSSCGGFSPVPITNVWRCDDPPCFTNIGNWNPTVPFNFSGTQSMAQCYGSSCASQTMTFNLDVSRTSGCPTWNSGPNTFDGCNWGTSLCVSLDTWSVTVQGRTIETLGNTATGNGSTSLIASSCAGGVTTTLDPTPEYGVPGYTYNWSTGQSTPTIDVSGFSSGDIFTADVTDACGSTVTATFEVTCPLSVDLMNFTTENMDESVVLRWSTASERDNDFFEVLRSSDGEHFESIGKIQGAGNATTTNHYSFVDNSPEDGINYYKLRIVDFDGVEEFSSIESVNRVSAESSIVCVPNPAKEKVNIFFNFPENDFYTISLYDMMGKQVYQTNKYFEKGTQSHMINTSNLPRNVYNVKITTSNHVHTSRLIIE
jgi:hypothetical protein